MKRLKFQSGLTLVEMLIVVGIVAVLASIALRLATRVEGQGRERLTRATISILNAALGQFADYRYRYPNEAYAGFDFPVDCTEIPDPCGLPPVFLAMMRDVMLEPQLGPSVIKNVTVTIGPMGCVHNPEYSGCEAMYFFLSQVPTCRNVLDKIDKSLLTNMDINKLGLEMTIQVQWSGNKSGTNTKVYPLTRVVDAWGTALHYDYYTTRHADRYDWAAEVIPPGARKKTFPVITSAGPDRLFNTSDDIQVERKP